MILLISDQLSDKNASLPIAIKSSRERNHSSKIWLTYLNDVSKPKNGDYTAANSMLKTMKSIQKLLADKSILPEEDLVDLEIITIKKYFQ